jgi:uncharacterized membrane protein
MERPRIKLEKTQFDRVLEGLIYAGIIAVWLYPAIQFGSLPESIPVHFNAAGEADGFGDRTTIWWLPAVCTVIVAMLLLLGRIPHTLNYPVPINPANAEKQYRLATGLLRVLSLSIVIVFLLLEIMSIQTALSGADEFSSAWILPVVMIMVFSPIGYFVIKMFSSKT